MKNEFATNLRKARAEKGWSQQQVAEQIGIKQKRYAAYEEGRADPSIQTLAAITKLFGITDFYTFLVGPEVN